MRLKLDQITYIPFWRCVIGVDAFPYDSNEIFILHAWCGSWNNTRDNQMRPTEVTGNNVIHRCGRPYLDA